MHHIAAIAREAGIRELVAEVLSDNGAMLAVFEHSGLITATRREGIDRPRDDAISRCLTARGTAGWGSLFALDQRRVEGLVAVRPIDDLPCST